jgi:hypothetical protein
MYSGAAGGLGFDGNIEAGGGGGGGGVQEVVGAGQGNVERAERAAIEFGIEIAAAGVWRGFNGGGGGHRVLAVGEQAAAEAGQGLRTSSSSRQTAAAP